MLLLLCLLLRFLVTEVDHLLPRELVPTEVTTVGRLLINGPLQPEGLDDPVWAQVEVPYNYVSQVLVGKA